MAETENVLLQVVTVTEACEKWGKDPGNIRRDLLAGRYNQDARKSGATWLISVQALIRFYGKPKKPITF